MVVGVALPKTAILTLVVLVLNSGYLGTVAPGLGGYLCKQCNETHLVPRNCTMLHVHSFQNRMARKRGARLPSTAKRAFHG